jgi:homoserine kinase
MEACPLLARLLPLNNMPASSGVLGVALSGAGPSVLVIADKSAKGVPDAIRKAANDPDLEIIQTTIAAGATVQR